ncbi:Uncharacterized protein Adt_27550 [Abeliophyllum distichum]|uniref:Uncharacterized protein n=1 Tax=Abeliophyllum distichum TaxID=126358 RepID=A0ABD1RU15_9LAMI
MPYSFEELATRAHDLEIQIARQGSYLPSDLRDKKDPKKEIKRMDKLGNPKEATTISTVPTKITFQKSGSNPCPKPKLEFRPNKVQVQRKGLHTLKEHEENKYPFSDSEVSGILDHLLKQKIIELLVRTRLEEAGQVDHLKYCRFHEIISHPVESCSMVSFGSFDPIPISNKRQTFPTPYDIGKSLFEVTEFGPQLPKGAIPVELKVDKEITITYIYLDMVKLDSGNHPTFYEIMTDDLDV